MQTVNVVFQNTYLLLHNKKPQHFGFWEEQKKQTKFRSGLADSSSLQEEGHLVPKGTPIS